MPRKNIPPLCLGLVFIGLLSGLSAQVLPTQEWIHFYSDSSTVNGRPIAAGTRISVLNEKGYLCGEVWVRTAGQYGFLPVYRDDGTSTLIEGATPGEILLFYLHGLMVPPGFNFPVWTSNGAVLKWDLHIQVPEGPRLQMTPATVNFPATRIGSTARHDVWLSNIGTEVLQIQERTCLPDANFGLKLEPVELPPGASIAVPVFFRPNFGQGLASTEFTLKTNTPEPNYARIRLQGEVISDILPSSAWLSVGGTCQLDELPAPVGTFIDVYDLRGGHCGSGRVEMPGLFGPFRIYGDDPSTATDEGPEPGEPLQFSVQGYPALSPATDTLRWTGANQQLDIDLVALANFPPELRYQLSDLVFTEDSPPFLVARLDTLFADRNCDDLSFEIASSNELVQASLGRQNELWLTLAPDQSGFSLISVQARDQSTTVTDHFRVTVLAVNDPPRIIDLPDEYTVINTDTLRIRLKSHALDIDSPEAGLRWSVASLTPALQAGLESDSSALFWAPGFIGQAQALLILSDDAQATNTLRLSLTFQAATTVALAFSDLPTRLELQPVFPNPFNPNTTLHYQLPQVADVEIKIFDLRARQIGHWQFRSQPPGRHQLDIDLKNEPSGIYFLRFQAGAQVTSQRLVLLK